MQFWRRFGWIFANFGNFRLFFEVAKNCPQILPEPSQRHRRACKRFLHCNRLGDILLGAVGAVWTEVLAKNSWKYPEFETFRKVQKISRLQILAESSQHPRKAYKSCPAVQQTCFVLFLSSWSSFGEDLVRIFRKISNFGLFSEGTRKFSRILPESSQQPLRPSNSCPTSQRTRSYQIFVFILSLSRIETCQFCQFLSVFWIARFGDSWYWKFL